MIFTPAMAIVGMIAAVGVPLAIHLLFRRRYRIVSWAAIRFLLVAERRHHRRLEQWILLLVRIMVLTLPLAAMVAATSWAERFWQYLWPGSLETVIRTPRTHHILVLDGTLSSLARLDSGDSRWEEIQRQARQLLEQANSGDAFSVVLVGEGVEIPVPGPTIDTERVGREIDLMHPVPGATPLATALPLIEDILARSPPSYPRKQVTFLTDLQRAAWQGLLKSEEQDKTSDAWQRLTKRADVAIVDVARHDTDNLCVAEVRISDPAPLVNSAVSVSAVIVNFGLQECQDLPVQLLIARPGGDYTHPVASEQVVIKSLPPGGRTTVTFGQQTPIRFSEIGQHLVVVQVTNRDALAQDDRRGLVVPVRGTIPVALVEGRPEAQAQRRTAVDLQRALLPDPEAGEWTPARPRVLTVAEFSDPALGSLEDVDAVYLCDLPVPSPEWLARLEAFSRRGGTIIWGLGPNTAAHLQEYNRILHQGGKGLLPFPLEEVVGSAPVPDKAEESFRLAASEEAFRQPLLALFRDERVRGGLISVPFRRYIRVRPTPQSGVYRWMDFVPGQRDKGPAQSDPALLEWRWQRGRVFLFTSSFNEDWNDWPVLPTYLPFHQELLRYAAIPPDRHTLTVGDPLEEYYPLSSVGLTVRWQPPEGDGRRFRLLAEDQMAVVRIAPITQLGAHLLQADQGKTSIFWVNPPAAVADQLAEADLKRLNRAETALLQPAQVVTSVTEIVPSTHSGATITVAPRPRGPRLARGLAIAALLILLLEVYLAWRWGPAAGWTARPSTISTSPPTSAPSPGRLLWQMPLVLVASTVFVLLLLLIVQDFRHQGSLDWLPAAWRERLEQVVKTPAPVPGENAAIRLERSPLLFRQPGWDRWALLGALVALLAGIIVIYRRERHATSWLRLGLPAIFRFLACAVVLLVILLQWQVVFDRQGWPDLVVVIDVSRSMSHTDDFKDPAVRAVVEELAQGNGSASLSRLQLVQKLLTDPRYDGLAQLLRQYQVRLHLFSLEGTLRPLSIVEDETSLENAREVLNTLQAEGNASRLGDGVQTILKAFRGAPLSGVVLFTDGIITAGEDWAAVAQQAAQAGVPLYLIGIGDTWEAPDLILSDLQSEDTVTIGDRLVFDARLSLRSTIVTTPVPVILYEKDRSTGQLIERARVDVLPRGSGVPTPVTLTYSPQTPGEKIFVLQVPPLPGESYVSNNRLERTVWVTEARRLRVLLVEGRPRYDFRFLKVLLERESEHSLGGRSMEVETVLLNASQGWANTDRSAFRGDFPTREQLFAYDVVVLGDIDPRQLPHTSRTLQDLAEFVTQRGGGLLLLSGAHFTPASWADTPLADVLPITLRSGVAEASSPVATEGFRLHLTELGQQHPCLRLAPDPADSLRLWQQLPLLYWHASGYQRKPHAIVLATAAVPGRSEADQQPLILQTFAGAGTVLFLGFDDTWRWRWRQYEEHFDRFWLQTIRFLGRARVRRPELKVVPKAEFRRDETMKVVVRFPVETSPPDTNQTVRVTLLRRPLHSSDGSATSQTIGGEVQTLTLTRVPGPLPQYEYLLTRTPEGEYHFTLSEPESPPGQPPPAATVRVLPPWTELDRLELNRQELQEAAARSQGRFFTLVDVKNLWSDLPPFPRIPLHQSEPPFPLWNLPVIYALVLVLLTSEWLLRKSVRLL